MPQTFQVLRCYKCLVFQVHQIKKSVKWECKLCGEKQSIKRHYGIGMGKDCRIHVQNLNSIRGELDELKCGQMKRNAESEEECESLDNSPQTISIQEELTKKSKWTTYVEEVEAIEDSSKESMCLGNTEVVLEIPTKRRKKINNYNRENYTTNNVSSVFSMSCSLQVQACNKIKNENPLHYNAKTDITETFPLSMSELEKENTKPKMLSKKFVPPTINKNSKWAQFADADDETVITPSQSLESSQADQMFSLCDDNEIDHILNL